MRTVVYFLRKMSTFITATVHPKFIFKSSSFINLRCCKSKTKRLCQSRTQKEMFDRMKVNIHFLCVKKRTILVSQINVLFLNSRRVN